MDFEVALGYGNDKPDFWIGRQPDEGPASGPNREIHVAFQAADAAAVRAFFEAAKELGAEVLHEPRHLAGVPRPLLRRLRPRPRRQQRRGGLPHRPAGRLTHGVSDLGSLTPDQQRLLAAWFDVPEVVADHSWGLVDTVVLHVRVRRSGRHRQGRRPRQPPPRPRDHRPATVGPAVGRDRVGRARFSTRPTRAACWPSSTSRDGWCRTCRQRWPTRTPTVRPAGSWPRFHGQASRIDDEYAAAADEKALAWLAREHRVAPATVADLRAAIASHTHEPVELIPTHGDWQPRNWLIHDGVIRVIDLGRSDWRPAATDFARLARQEWVGRPDLEAAFLEGYAVDPREPAAWRAMLLQEAIGTAVWAYSVGDDGVRGAGPSDDRGVPAHVLTLVSQPVTV